MDFTDKIVLITGASRGIGKATAIAFAERNATVIVNYHKNKEAAEETLGELPGGGHMLYQADVCDPQSVREMIEAIVSRYEKLDVVVNNAGLSIFHPIDEVDFNEWITGWRMTLEMNLIAPANVCYFAAQQMIKQGGGRIVNVSSRGAFRGEPTKPGAAQYLRGGSGARLCGDGHGKRNAYRGRAGSSETRVSTGAHRAAGRGGIRYCFPGFRGRGVFYRYDH